LKGSLTAGLIGLSLLVQQLAVSLPGSQITSAEGGPSMPGSGMAAEESIGVDAIAIFPGLVWDHVGSIHFSGLCGN